MKTTVVTDKTKVTEYRTVKLKVGKFTVTEGYTDGELANQVWSIVGGFKNTHKIAYEPKHLSFVYYDDISFLDSDMNAHDRDYYKIVPESTLITDWNDFKGFNHVLCLWIGMDGNMYRIDRATPIAVWRSQDYIGGFSEKYYRDLPELQKELDALEFVRSTEIMQIPYYNGGGQAIEFEYKLPVRVWNTQHKITNPLIAKIAKKYKKSDY